MSRAIHQQMGPVEVLILIILSLVWGGSFFFVEILVDYLPPLSIVTFRVGLAALLLWGIVFLKDLPRPKSVRDWTALFIVGLTNNALPFCLIVWGQTQIDSGLASILNATAPLFTVILAGLFLTDERLTRNRVLGAVLGIFGVIGLIGPDALAGGSGSVWGQLAVITAALSYAVAGVFSRRFSEYGISPLMIATGQTTTAAFMLLPLMIYFDGGAIMGAIPLLAWLCLLGLALLSTVLAYVLYFKLIASAGATNAALVAFLIPISAVALGAIFLGERLGPWQIIGALLIGAGLIVIDGRLLARRPG